MKVSLIACIFILFFLQSCEKEKGNHVEAYRKINACNVDDPLNELNWLNDFISNGKDPKIKSFVDYVWIKRHQNEDIIIICFGLTSTMYHTYNCVGEIVVLNDIDFLNTLTDNDLIYKFR